MIIIKQYINHNNNQSITTSLSPLPCFSFFLFFPLLILPSYSFYTFYLLLFCFPPSLFCSFPSSSLLLLFFPPSQSWPDDALAIVARCFLDDIEMSLSDEVKEGCVVMCKELIPANAEALWPLPRQRHDYITLLSILSSSPPTRHFSQREERGCLVFCMFFLWRKKHWGQAGIWTWIIWVSFKHFPLSHWRSGWHRSRV